MIAPGIRSLLFVFQKQSNQKYTCNTDLNRYTIIEEHSKYLAEEKSADSDAYEEFDDNYEQAKASTSRFKIILIIQVPKTLGRSITGFQVAKWFCYHIDDLMDNLSIGNFLDYQDKSLS